MRDLDVDAVLLDRIYFHCPSIATSNLHDCHSSIVVIRIDGEKVPISFLIGSNGLATVTSLCLSLKFQLSEGSLNIKEEVSDPVFGDLTHMIG
jgi:hypothetical protein